MRDSYAHLCDGLDCCRFVVARSECGDRIDTVGLGVFRLIDHFINRVPSDVIDHPQFSRGDSVGFHPGFQDQFSLVGCEGRRLASRPVEENT